MSKYPRTPSRKLTETYTTSVAWLKKCPCSTFSCDEPVMNVPPWKYTTTGKTSSVSGRTMSRVRQSSEPITLSLKLKVVCIAGGANTDASRTPSHSGAGRGARKRWAPAVESPNGTPRHVRAPVVGSTTPRTTPDVVRTSGCDTRASFAFNRYIRTAIFPCDSLKRVTVGMIAHISALDGTCAPNLLNLGEFS